MADFTSHMAALDRLQASQDAMNEGMRQKITSLEHALEVESNKRRDLSKTVVQLDKAAQQENDAAMERWNALIQKVANLEKRVAQLEAEEVRKCKVIKEGVAELRALSSAAR